MTSSLSSGATRASLVSRAQKRDPAAWRDLVALYGPLIGHWCKRCGLDTHGSADCMQDVFASVSSTIDRFRSQNVNGSFRSWLWTITNNKVRDHLRRVAKQPISRGGSSALNALERVPDEQHPPDEEPTDWVQLNQLTRRALAQVEGEFEARTWKAFWRSVIDGVTSDQVAEELGVSSGAVRQSRSRILRRLRQQLGDID